MSMPARAECWKESRAQSETDVSNRAHAIVGDHATITVTGGGASSGHLLLNAFNDVQGQITANLDTGGVVLLPGVTSHFNVNVNEAIATVGASDTITTAGDFDLEAHAVGAISSSPTSHTYGLASGGTVSAHIGFTNSDQVAVGTLTTVTAQGTINLLAGIDSTGARDAYTLKTEGYVLDATLVPIVIPTSDVDLEQTKSVTVGTGATLSTAQDANLSAQTLTKANLISTVTDESWVSESGLTSVFHNGTVENNTTTSVAINGAILVGINRDQSLTIDAGPATTQDNITKVTKNTSATVTTTVETVASNLITQRNLLLSLIDAYSGDLAAAAAYTAQLTLIDQQMKALGLATTVSGTNPDTNQTFSDTFYSAQASVPYVTVSPIVAQSGTINIDGDIVTGAGSLNAPGNVTVTIINNSAAYLRLEGIDIPDNVGGRVVWNGVNITNDSELGGFTGGLSVSADTAQPQINIEINYNADDPQNASSKFTTPDLEIDGDIDNVGGSPTIKRARQCRRCRQF